MFSFFSFSITFQGFFKTFFEILSLRNSSIVWELLNPLWFWTLQNYLIFWECPNFCETMIFWNFLTFEAIIFCHSSLRIFFFGYICFLNNPKNLKDWNAKHLKSYKESKNSRKRKISKKQESLIFKESIENVYAKVEVFWQKEIICSFFQKLRSFFWFDSSHVLNPKDKETSSLHRL